MGEAMRREWREERWVWVKGGSDSVGNRKRERRWPRPGCRDAPPGGTEEGIRGEVGARKPSRLHRPRRRRRQGAGGRPCGWVARPRGVSESRGRAEPH